MAKDTKKKGGLLQRLRTTKQQKVDPELALLLDEVQNDPSNMRARRKLADYYLKKEDKVRAMDQYLTVAETYADKGFYPKAVAVYKQALQIDPNMIEVYLKLATLYHKLGLIPEVVEQYQKAAAIYEAQGKEREALDIRRQLLDLDATNVVGRLKLGQRYLEKGYGQEAVVEFLRVADIFQNQGKTTELQKLLEGILDRGVENFDVLYRLVELYREQKRPDLALQRLAKLTGELAGSVSTLELTAELAEELGKPVIAVKALERAGQLYEEIKRQDKVREVCERILAIDIDNEYAARFLEEMTAPPVAEAAPEEEVAEEIAVEEEAEEIAIEEEISLELDEEEIGIEEEIAIEEVSFEEETPAEAEIEMEEIAIEEETAYGEIDLSKPEEPVVEEIAIEEEPTIEEIDLDEELVVEEIAIEEEPLVEEIAIEEEPVVEEIAIEEEPQLDEPEIAEEEAAVEDEYEEVTIEEEETVLEEMPFEEVTLDAEAAAETEAEMIGEVEATEAPTAEVEEISFDEPAIEEVVEEEEEGPEQLDLATMSEEEAAQRLDEAIDIYLKYNLRDKAVEYLDLALQRNPESLPILEKMMIVYRDGGNEDKANEMLDQLVDMAQQQGRTDKLEQYLSLMVEYQPEDMEAAGRLAEHYAETEPERAVVHFFELVGRYRDLGRFDEAEKLLERVLELDAANEGAHQELLDIYQQTDRVEKAISELYFLYKLASDSGDTAGAEGYLKSVIEYRPTEQQAHDSLAEIYQTTGQTEKLVDLLRRMADRLYGAGELPMAQHYYERLLATDPKNLLAYLKLKDLYVEMDQPEDAIAQLFTIARLASDQNAHDKAIYSLREILTLDPENRVAHERLRDLYIATGDKEHAIAEIMSLAKAALDEQKPEEALDHLARILELEPRHEQTLRRKVSILRDLDRVEEAMETLFAMARDWERMGQPAKAEKTLREILEIQPDSLRVRETLKDLFLNSGLTEKAITALVELAEVAQSQGETEDALTYWGEIIGLDPDNVAARKGIANLHLMTGAVNEAVAEMVAVAEIQARNYETDAAVETLQSALAHDSTNEVVLNRLIGLYFETGRVNNAVDLLTEAGEQAAELGRLDLAQNYYGKVVEAAPSNIAVRNKFKNVLLEVGDSERAIEQLFALADLFAADGETTRVEETFRSILELDPQREQASLALKDHYLQVGRLEAALDLLNGFMGKAKREGQYELAHQYAEEMLAAAENDRRALLTLAEIAVITGDRQDAASRYLQLATLSETESRVDDAESFLGKVLELDSTNVDAHRRIADLLLAREETPGAVEHLFALADLAVQDGDTARAEALYREVLSVDAKNEPALEHLISLFVAAGEGERAIPEMFSLSAMAADKQDYVKAEKYLNQILDLDPDNEQAIEALSQVHIAAGDTGQAISELFTLENAADAKGDYEAALDLVKRILDLEEENLSALNKKADLEEVLDHRDDAIDTLLALAKVQIKRDLLEDGERTLRRVIRAVPDNAVAHEELVNLLTKAEAPRAVIDELLRFNAAAIESGDAQTIAEVAERILGIDPQFERAHRMLVEVYKKQGDNEQAIAQLFELVDIAADLGRAQDAEALYKEILGLDLVNTLANERLTSIYIESGRYEDAIRLLLSYGDALNKAADVAGAREAYEQVLTLNSGNDDALRKLKDSYFEAEEFVETIQVLQRAVDAYDDRGEGAKAIAALEEILDIDAQNDRAFDELKNRYLESNQTDKAVDLLFAADKDMVRWDDPRRVSNIEEILQIDSKNERALQRLVDLHKKADRTDAAIENLLALANLHAGKSDTVALEKDLRGVLDLDAANIPARQKLVAYYRDTDNTQALVDMLFDMAAMQRRSGDLTGAQGSLMDVVDLGVEKERALNELSEIYRQSGDAQKQLETRLQLADISRESGDNAGAEAIYQEMLGADPDNLDARRALIKLYEEIGRTKDAADQTVMLAEKARKDGEDNDAIDFYLQALELDPTNSRVRRRLKKLLVDAGRNDDAVAQLRALADAANLENEFDDVEDALREMLQYQPENNDIRNELIELYSKTEQPDKAVVELLEMAHLLRDGGNAQKAHELVERAVALQPDNSAALQELKDAHIAVDDKKKAIEILFNLYDIDVKANKRHSAEKCLREILVLDPNNTVAKEKVFDLFKIGASVEEQIAELLAEAEEAQVAGRREAAEDALNKVLELDPEQHEARSRLKALYAEPRAVKVEPAAVRAAHEPQVTEEEARVFEDVDLSAKAESMIDEDIAIDWGEPAEVEFAAETISVDDAVEEDVFGGTAEEEVEEVDVFGDVSAPAQKAAAKAEEIELPQWEPEPEPELEPEVEPGLEAELEAELEPELEAQPEAELEPALEAEPVLDTVEKELGSLFDTVEVSSEDFIETGEVPARHKPATVAEKPADKSRILEDFRSVTDEIPSEELLPEAEEVEAVEFENEAIEAEAVSLDEAEAQVEALDDLFEAVPEVDAEPAAPRAKTEATTVADLLGDLDLSDMEMIEPEAKAEAAEVDLFDEIFGAPEKPAKPAVSTGDSLDDLIGGLTMDADEAKPAEAEDDIFESFVSSLGDGAAAAGNAQAHYELGIAFREMDSIEEAIAEFEKALTKDSGEMSFEINYELGQCYASLDKFEMAVEYLESALSEGSDDDQSVLDLTFELGVALKKLSKLAEAIRYFTEVDKKSSNYRGAKDEIAECEKMRKGMKKKKGKDDDNIGFL